ncbi:MAG TPA: hypothetical protein DD782_01800 [Firmicutes bacterium]|nr:hypothetical protein [Bacillota bacterium]
MYLILRSWRAGIALLLLLFACCVTLSGCATLPTEQTIYAMDTFITIKAYGPDASAAVNKAMAVFTTSDQHMNVFDSSSELAMVNAASGQKAVQVSADTFKVIEAALAMARLTDGAFNPLIGRISGLWKQAEAQNQVPDREQIRRALRFTDYRKVILDPSTSTVELTEAGMAFDLGGAAKGYATGAAMERLVEPPAAGDRDRGNGGKGNGVRHALINAGGNIVVFGGHPEKRPWNISITHPRNSERFLGTLSINEGAVVTSGDYERFFIQNGERYHHIIDPATGFPATGMQSVSIVSSDSLQADLLSTAVFVMGVSKGLAFLESHFPEVGAILVDSDGEIHMTPGFRERFSWR